MGLQDVHFFLHEFSFSRIPERRMTIDRGHRTHHTAVAVSRHSHDATEECHITPLASTWCYAKNMGIVRGIDWSWTAGQRRQAIHAGLVLIPSNHILASVELVL